MCVCVCVCVCVLVCVCNTERDWEPGQIAWRTKFDDDVANVRVGFEISRSISDFSGTRYGHG